MQVTFKLQNACTTSYFRIDGANVMSSLRALASSVKVLSILLSDLTLSARCYYSRLSSSPSGRKARRFLIGWLLSGWGFQHQNPAAKQLWTALLLKRDFRRFQQRSVTESTCQDGRPFLNWTCPASGVAEKSIRPTAISDDYGPAPVSHRQEAVHLRL